jgi:hypothetical protein
MLQILLIGLVILSGCQSSTQPESDQQTNGSRVREAFAGVFTSPECDNPCWLGIEVGVTTREEALRILEAHDVEFTFEGYVGGILHFHHIPDGLVPGLNAEGTPPGNVYGDMSIGENASDIVFSTDFNLDLCVATILEAYGIPSIWGSTILVYLDRHLFFHFDTTSRRIDWVFLHQADAMPPPEELDAWSDHADFFSGECFDEFTG